MTQAHEQIINDICEIAAMPHDAELFKKLVTALYQKGVIQGHIDANNARLTSVRGSDEA